MDFYDPSFPCQVAQAFATASRPGTSKDDLIEMKILLPTWPTSYLVPLQMGSSKMQNRSSKKMLLVMTVSQYSFSRSSNLHPRDIHCHPCHMHLFQQAHGHAPNAQRSCLQPTQGQQSSAEAQDVGQHLGSMVFSIIAIQAATETKIPAFFSCMNIKSPNAASQLPATSHALMALPKPHESTKPVGHWESDPHNVILTRPP